MGSLNNSPLYSDVLIVGAGFGGCYLLHLLRKAGFTTLVLDAANTIGGRYPGARVDCELPYYGFSDSNIWSTFHWKERFSSGDELRAYFQHVANVWDLHKDIRLNSTVISATYDEDQATWTVKTNDNQVFQCHWLVAATGSTFVPYIPKWKGLDNFQGSVIHPARWPEKPVQLEGKRVAVIGSGSTGLQILQETAKVCSRVIHFVRSPNTAFPMRQRAIGEDEWNAHKPQMIPVLEGCRTTSGGMPDATVPGRFSDSAEVRRAAMEEGWRRGGTHWLASVPPDFLENPKSNREAYDFWCHKTRQRINDPVKRDILAPLEQPYYIQARRPGVEQDYYECCDQENVVITKSSIFEFTTTGVITEDGTEHDVDLVIACTGYDAVTGSLWAMNIKGRNGLDLDEKWKDGIVTHLGIFAHDFPNICMVYGPQAPTPLTNGPVFLEIQCEFIAKVLKRQREQNILTIEAKADAEQAWREYVLSKAEQTLFVSADSWYMGANIPGKRKEFLVYVGGIPLYKTKMDEALQDWNGFDVYHGNKKHASPTARAEHPRCS